MSPTPFREPPVRCGCPTARTVAGSLCGPAAVALRMAGIEHRRWTSPGRARTMRPGSGEASVSEDSAVSPLDAVRTNLVPAATSFVGREAELGDLGRLIESSRLVTVTGPPGAGKTRLAMEFASRLDDRFEDGAWLVGLAQIADPQLVLPALAGALGLTLATDRPALEAGVVHLPTRRLLVVLDNFEHLTEAATDVAALVAACPGLHLVVTSRTLL